MHPYMRRLDNSEDWLATRCDPKTDGKVIEEQFDILQPEGPHLMYEWSASHFYDATTYHEHKIGWETFIVHSGKLDLTVQGKTATVEAGDVICLPPWTPHKMQNLVDGGYFVWDAIFHDIDMLQNMANWNLIQRTNPDMLNDPAIQQNYLANKNNVLRENPPLSVHVPKEEIRFIRPADKPLAKYEMPGCTMSQFTARWENNGLSEVWRADMKKGFSVKYNKYDPNVDLFYIVEGEVRFNIAGEEFVAGPRTVVKVPHYASRCFEALTDVRMFDAGGSTHWADFIEDYINIKVQNAEKLNDAQYMKDVFERHECYLDSVKFEDSVII